MKKINILKNGMFGENPVFRLALGLCPVLAVTTSVKNGIGMGLSTTFVLVCSSVIISFFKKIIPGKIRIPCFVVVIASFVTIVDLVLKGFFPGLSKSLGIFIPLIVVNCIILGRAEAFASKNTILDSLIDGIGMGLGFTGSLLLISIIREVLGSNKFLGYLVIPGYNPAIMMILPPGGFLTMGILLAYFNYLKQKKKGENKNGI